MRALVSLLIAFGLGACASTASPTQTDNSAPMMSGAVADDGVEHNLAVVREDLWQHTTIPVCWERVADSSAENRALVQRAATESWQSHTVIRFVGWGECAPASDGIRIRVEDSGPHTKGLGRRLNAITAGMVLNFTFINWSPACQTQRDACIYSIAVHEFGHAIGATHEQNRPETPGECAVRAQGTNPDTMLTPYDPRSVMNYCNPVYNNNGQLTDYDIRGINLAYPSAH